MSEEEYRAEPGSERNARQTSSRRQWTKIIAELVTCLC